MRKPRTPHLGQSPPWERARLTPLRGLMHKENVPLLGVEKWLPEVEFASAVWDSDLNSFLQRVGENLESIMIEKWMEERVMEKVPGNLTSGCKFHVLVAP